MNIIVPFGKYKDKSIDELKKDKNYLNWCLKNEVFDKYPNIHRELFPIDKKQSQRFFCVYCGEKIKSYTKRKDWESRSFHLNCYKNNVRKYYSYPEKYDKFTGSELLNFMTESESDHFLQNNIYIF